MAIDKNQPDDFDPVWLDARLDAVGRGADRVIPLLQAIQKRYNYLPRPALAYVCENSAIAPADIAGVSTFYDMFRHTPAGRHRINVCVGTACHVAGAELVYESFRRHLGCAENEDTDPRRLFTLGRVACLGCCTLAPAVQIDGAVYGRVSAASVPDVIRDFLGRQGARAGGENAAKERKRAFPDEIRISLGSCCTASGSRAVWNAAQGVIDRYKLPVTLKRAGCVSMCHRTPLVSVVTGGAANLYAKVSADDVPGIILRHFRPAGAVDRAARWIDAKIESLLLSEDAEEGARRRRVDAGDESVRDFLGRQTRVVMERCGEADPLDIDEYARGGGFAALRKCLGGMSADGVIDWISDSGLRGRGGAGFPTGRKWRAARDRSLNRGGACVICNGDEGDPGAFMDRMLFESFPYRIIEGMLIAAYAVGAGEGIFYIRTEYKTSIAVMREAIETCEMHGIIGDDIFGSGFSVKVTVVEGAGAFVCGEETALIKSIEGKRGTPAPKPPYPAESGLWGKPTLVNNCETLACVPWIIREGAERFRATGTPQSPGTKVFALAGKTARGGLIETPMGATLRDIIERIGGGIAGGKRFKAVQIGGPSGGCLPAELCDIPVDYEKLAEAGAMMGSGGLVVLDESDCMVDIARYFLAFTQGQSCGRCTFCRVGTRRMLDILEKICAGKGDAGDLPTLEELAVSVKSASLCGLGKTAPNPVLTTLKYFRDEYEAHIRGVCPAGKCKAMISYAVTEKCGGCTICSRRCPVNAISFAPYRRHSVDDDLCTRCGACRAACPLGAIEIIPRRGAAR